MSKIQQGIKQPTTLDKMIELADEMIASNKLFLARQGGASKRQKTWRDYQFNLLKYILTGGVYNY